MNIQELEKKLKNEIETADWSMLKDHFIRGTIFVIFPEVGLINAATAIAIDDAISVSMWREKNLLRVPLQSETEEWNKTPHQKLARFLIIQPYVILELLPEHGRLQ